MLPPPPAGVASVAVVTGSHHVVKTRVQSVAVSGTLAGGTVPAFRTFISADRRDADGRSLRQTHTHTHQFTFTFAVRFSTFQPPPSLFFLCLFFSVSLSYTPDPVHRASPLRRRIVGVSASGVLRRLHFRLLPFSGTRDHLCSIWALFY